MAPMNARGHLFNLLCIAMADSDMDPRELAMIYQFAQRGGMTLEEIKTLLENPHQLRAHQPGDAAQLIGQLHDLASLVMADGKIDVREIRVLREVVSRFGVDAHEIDLVVEGVIERVQQGASREQLIQQMEAMPSLARGRS
jgi:uncharacterized tellurite resistance protein B-like protein